MEQENETVEAVLVEDGRIQQVGLIKQMPQEGVTWIDLGGKTLLPGFIDSHSHIAAFAMTLLTASLETVTTKEEMVAALKKFKKDHSLTEEDWIVGFGYDHNQLPTKSHPDRSWLDEVSLTNPIIVSHKSGHMGVLNSKALAMLGVTDAVADPEGGHYGKDQGGHLTGYVEETAFQQCSATGNFISFEQLVASFQKAEQIYLQYGITSVQEGLTDKDRLQLLTYLQQHQLLHLDVISYLDYRLFKDYFKTHSYEKTYQHHFRIGGYKLILDGSPQGKTAYLSKPYEKEEKYRGYPSIAFSELQEKVKTIVEEKVQLLCHCNGDAASQMLIDAYETLPLQNFYRPVMIHAQTVTKDQLLRMKTLGIIPSYFASHIYYWGDVHLQNLGSRAYMISPLATTIKEGLPYTLHQDTPVLRPDMLFTIWCCCARITQGGITLGEEEKISVYQALEGITKFAAYQYFEESQKGTIAVNKLADFVILDQNPLAVSLDEIKHIKVVATIKEGVCLFGKES